MRMNRSRRLAWGRFIIDATTTAVIILSGLPCIMGHHHHHIMGHNIVILGITPDPDFWSDTFFFFSWEILLQDPSIWLRKFILGQDKSSLEGCNSSRIMEPNYQLVGLASPDQQWIMPQICQLWLAMHAVFHVHSSFVWYANPGWRFFLIKGHFQDESSLLWFSLASAWRRKGP